MPATPTIRLLGRLQVEQGGAPVELPARKSEALLAVLARRPGVPHGREQLAALLWPEVAEAQARTSLRQALGHLRSRISDALIKSSADQLYLEPAAASVDVAELERILRRPPLEREPAQHWLRGSLLEGFPAVSDAFADWLAIERARLSERLVPALEECLAALSAAGQLERALELGVRLTELEPARESVHRALIRLELARGEPAAALSRYERCRELLLRLLGVEPAPETAQLKRAAMDLRSEPAAAASEPSEALRGRIPLLVLPFECNSELEPSRLLAQGLSEDLRTELSRFRQLAIFSRAATPSAGSAQPQVLARELGAAVWLSGGVRNLGDKSRVTAALVDARTGLQLWAERWDVAHADLFDTLDRLTRSVVASLSLELDEAQLQQARRRARHDLRAYECWLRGMECVRRGDPGSDLEAREFFEQALSIEPDFARAHAGISLSHFNDWSCMAWDRWHERERLAFESAQRAVELDAGDHVSQFILGRIYVYRREFERGQRHLESALELNPNDTETLLHVALGLTLLGQAERAVELARAGLDLHPRCPSWYFAAAAVPHFFARKLEPALALAARAPDTFVDTRALLAAASALCGEMRAAEEHARAFLASFAERITPGREPEAARALAWLLEVNPLKRPEDSAYWLDGLKRAGLCA
jgi:DNA-binding SARP family transcriptional activator